MKKTIFAALILLMWAIPCPASDSDKPMGPPPGASGDCPPGPPPEAFKACEGKNAGDSATVTTPHGDTIEGICVDYNGKLGLRPSSPPPPPPDKKSE